MTLEPQPPLFMCGSLMQNHVLRISMWILGISALVGNCMVMILRVNEKTKSPIQAKQSFLVTNLAASDCIMGLYMLVLASADLYYGNEYFIYSEQWRTSAVCKLASFLSLLSSEASIFFITLITVDRFMCVVFPFSTIQLKDMSVKVSATIIWAFSVALAVVPTVFAGPDSDFYDLSDVCIGLPLITRPTSYKIESGGIGGGGDSDRNFDLPVPNEFQPAWYFSIAIFLGINLVCLVFIAVLYTAIFVSVKAQHEKVKAKSNHDENLKMAIRMAAIVGTDLICWLPVIIMGILSQTGAAVIPLQMYTWSVVFIIPINSSLNPYLYTIASVVSDYRSKRASEENSSSVISMDQTSTSKIIPKVKRMDTIAPEESQTAGHKTNEA